MLIPTGDYYNLIFYIKNIMTLYIVLVALGIAGYEAQNEEFVSRDMLNKVFDKTFSDFFDY